MKSLAAAADWSGSVRHAAWFARWSTTSEPPTPAVLTTIDGLPADRIEGIALDQSAASGSQRSKASGHFASGAGQKLPKLPSEIVAGIVVTPDGDNVGRRRDGPGSAQRRWSVGNATPGHDGDIAGPMTAAAASGSGTSGKRHHARRQAGHAPVGMAEGNDIDNVRAMVADASGSRPLSVGDGPGGQRVAFFDGKPLLVISRRQRQRH